MAGMSWVKLRERFRSKFLARSGCEASIPVSMMPTSTPRPVAFLWAWSASIIAMSHWRSASGSLVRLDFLLRCPALAPVALSDPLGRSAA